MSERRRSARLAAAQRASLRFAWNSLPTELRLVVLSFVDVVEDRVSFCLADPSTAAAAMREGGPCTFRDFILRLAIGVRTQRVFLERLSDRVNSEIRHYCMLGSASVSGLQWLCARMGDILRMGTSTSNGNFSVFLNGALVRRQSLVHSKVLTFPEDGLAQIEHVKGSALYGTLQLYHKATHIHLRTEHRAWHRLHGEIWHFVDGKRVRISFGYGHADHGMTKHLAEGWHFRTDHAFHHARHPLQRHFFDKAGRLARTEYLRGHAKHGTIDWVVRDGSGVRTLTEYADQHTEDGRTDYFVDGRLVRSEFADDHPTCAGQTWFMNPRARLPEQLQRIEYSANAYRHGRTEFYGWHENDNGLAWYTRTHTEYKPGGPRHGERDYFYGERRTRTEFVEGHPLHGAIRFYRANGAACRIEYAEGHSEHGRVEFVAHDSVVRVSYRRRSRR